MSRTDKDVPYRLRNREVYPYHWFRSPPKWYINHVWYGPQRAKVRIDVVNAIKDYRANSETDIETPSYQHRHIAQWLWW